VTDPILAWLALAPLRSLLREFPILAVTGSSGSGKTTLMETMVRNFTGSLITNNLTATTRHSVFAFIGSTNAFPVWFDEYRPGARKDAMESLNQLLRDAYTGQASSKGGMGEQWAEVTSVSTNAPIIVSGEDAFSETSHTERMVLVNLPVEGRRSDTLERVKGWGEHSFAYAYLTWLHLGLQDGSLPVIRNFEAGPEDLPGRQRLNLGALYLGWALLKQFVFQFGGVDLGEPDFSLVIEEGREAAQHNPIKDCILWALDEADMEAAVFYQSETIYVRPENLIAQAEKFGFVLPGGPKAITSYLRTNYGAETSQYTIYGKTRTALAFPAVALAQ
jgi:energy-coupling factor transporter ATP-binding protein EcfA2